MVKFRHGNKNLLKEKQMKRIPDFDIYVRFCETDAAGHVNNASYFFYIEEARIKFFDLLETRLNNKDKDLSFIIASTKCDYIKQAYAKQILTLTTNVTKIGTKSYNLEHEIKLAETGEVIAKGSAVVVCFNFQTQESIPIPTEMRAILDEYLVLDVQS